MGSQTLFNKVRKVQNLIKQQQRVMIALSGGVDSNLLLTIAQKTKPRRLIAITVSSPFVFPDEIIQARKIARSLGVKHIITPVRLLNIPKLVANTYNRCYLCKRRIFGHIRTIAKQHGLAILEASNLTDTKDFRPGLKALKELRILSPFIIARVTKSEIRTLAKRYGLVSWDKPANACLATRIPYKTKITPDLLQRIAHAETYLYNLGMRLVRVRAHGLIARIEVAPKDIPNILKYRKRIIRYFQGIGFTYITCDLKGYEAGNLN